MPWACVEAGVAHHVADGAEGSPSTLGVIPAPSLDVSLLTPLPSVSAVRAITAAGHEAEVDGQIMGAVGRGPIAEVVAVELAVPVTAERS